MKMNPINLEIDGKQIEVEKGATILEATQEAEIYIPHLCYHPDLPPFGACRLCIVEVEGMKGFLSSCTTPATEGMVVRTNTPEVQELRKNILELILTEHPAPCLTCSKNLNCELQRVAQYIDLEKLSLPYIHKEFPIKENPLFIRDYNLCILCGRCVSACQDLRGVGAITFNFRGDNAEIGTAFDLPLEDSDCKFCTACVEVCPTGALMDKRRWKSRDEKEQMLVPCRSKCPAQIDVPLYIECIAKGEFDKAVAVIREKAPFPGVLGRVCDHPCEDACLRGEIKEPIAIRSLKRFATDHDTGLWRERSKIAPPSGKKVAVIGAGPAGLTAAYYLTKLGHVVTVLDMLPEPGGMMRVGIPAYRLPRDVLNEEITEIEQIGVEIKLDTRVESLETLFNAGYHAIFLAIGAHKCIDLRIEGEEEKGVISCVSFLRDLNLGRKVEIGDRVGVIGGGNAAVDGARSALRLGADKVTIIYRRTRTEMPASSEEVDGALEEGVEIVFLAAPTKVTRNRKLKVEFIRMELGEPDASGRRRPIPIKGSEFTMNFDTLISAIGQRPDIPPGYGLEVGKGNRIVVDPDTLATSKKGVFAGGDGVTGPATVIEAISEGRKAAESIDRYLGGDGVIEERLIEVEEMNPYIGKDEDFVKRPRAKMLSLPIEQRLDSFREIELGFDEETAIDEAKKCLKCPLRLQISPVELPPDTGYGQEYMKMKVEKEKDRVKL